MKYSNFQFRNRVSVSTQKRDVINATVVEHYTFLFIFKRQRTIKIWRYDDESKWHRYSGDDRVPLPHGAINALERDHMKVLAAKNKQMSEWFTNNLGRRNVSSHSSHRSGSSPDRRRDSASDDISSPLHPLNPLNPMNPASSFSGGSYSSSSYSSCDDYSSSSSSSSSSSCSFD